MLRTITIIGWICFALDALFVLILFVQRNMGDDAAGRGMATGFAMILSVPLLIAGSILLWGTLSANRYGMYGGALFAAIPFLFLAFNNVRGLTRQASRAAWSSREGKFADPVLTQMASAIDDGDAETVRALLAQGPRDWSQRDPHGKTILGYAVRRATYPSAPQEYRAVLEILFDGGVPYAANAESEDEDWFARTAYNSGNDYNDLLELALTHGANPNVPQAFDPDPLIFGSNMTPEKLDLFAKHGANVQARGADPGIRAGWTGVMNAVADGRWDVALWFLRHGISLDVVGRDGQTLHDIFAQAAEFRTNTNAEPDASFDAFRAAMDSALGAARHR